MASLEGRVAIVTGASGALGRSITEALAAEGAAVVVHYGKNRDAADDVVRAVEEKGGRARAVQADVTVAADAQRLVQETVEALGGVHILVNNAGITRDTLVLRMKEEDWDSVIDTNLTGTFNCTKAVLREFLRQRGGRIINITSVAGQLGSAGQANYSAAKAGIIGMTKAIAREVASRGITVNAVAPGFIDAGITQQLPPEVAKGNFGKVP